MKHRNFILLFGVVALILGLSACEEDESVFNPSGFGLIDPLDNEIIVNRNAGTYDLEFYTSVPYHVELLENIDWLTVSAGEAVDGVAVIGLKYEANEDFSRKTSFVVLSDSDASLCDTIVFKQRAGIDPILTVNDPGTWLSQDGGGYEVPLTTNIPTDRLVVEVEYADEGVEGWITGFSTVSDGSSDGYTVVFAFDRNSDTSPRSATATLSFSDDWDIGEVSAEISLRQYNVQGYAFHSITFEELRNTYATGDPITEYVGITGIVVSNKDNGNAGCLLQTSTTSMDKTPATKTIYFESDDAGYGIVIFTDAEEDNIFEQYDKVTLILQGSTVTPNDHGPLRYELTGFNPDMVFELEHGEDAPVKKRTIGTLKPEDMYTYVELTDVEFPIRKASLFPVDGGYTWAGSSTMDCAKYPLLVRDKDGGSLYMLTNETCPYQRDGTRLPYGTGSIHGVVVHEHFSRFGNWASGLGDELNDIEAEKLNESYGYIGEYQLRHQTKDDVWGDMDDDPLATGVSTLLCEYRYRVMVTNTIDTSFGTNIDVPSYGSNGFMSHTYNNSGTNSTRYGGMTSFDYLGPIGRRDAYVDGTNYGNKNGLGIIIDPEKENTSYSSDRFADNKNGYTEFACQYATNSYAGYGSDGWVESYKTSYTDDNQNVPNHGNSSSNAGKGHVQSGLYIERSTNHWYDDDTPQSAIVYVTTSGLSASVVSMQLFMRASGSGFSPRYWTVEWATPDSMTAVDDLGGLDWTKTGEFTLPDAGQSGTSAKLWQFPAYKAVNIELPTDIMGHEHVYVRIRPTNDKCGCYESDYDTEVWGSFGNTTVTSRGSVSFDYVAIRYN